MKDKFVVPNDTFSYQYLAGPVESAAEIDNGLTEGNCRFAIQLYVYRVHDHFLKKEEVYLPGGYEHLGEFVYREETIDFGQLQTSDIMYAQNLKKKDGTPHQRNPEDYQTLADWRFHFHSAIYLGKYENEHYVYHASSICDGPAIWSLTQFNEYYRPISIKRLTIPQSRYG